MSSRGNEGSQFQIPKLLNFQILSLLFLLCSFFSNAQQTQPYEWDWAISGGSSIGGITNETIHDIKVGIDGNYYFIATIYGSGQIFNAQLDGQSVYPNNLPNNLGGGAKDIFLFSTDCDGEVLWSQAIGGGSDDIAYNLVLNRKNPAMDEFQVLESFRKNGLNQTADYLHALL